MMDRPPDLRTADRDAEAGPLAALPEQDRIAAEPAVPRRPARSRARWLAKRVTCILVLSVELVVYVGILVMAEPDRVGIGLALLIVLVCTVLVFLLCVELLLLQIGHEALESFRAALERS